MAALNTGASAPREPARTQVGPESENPPVRAGLLGRDQERESLDSAEDATERKLAHTTVVRAELLGLQLEPLDGGACLLKSDRRAAVVVPSLGHAAALLAGVERVRCDVAALLAQRTEVRHVGRS